MDMSSIRTALNGFADASPVASAAQNNRADRAFLLGENAQTMHAQTHAGVDRVVDLNVPDAWAPSIMTDFTQNDALEIDYPCGQAAPIVSLNYNVSLAATEVRLDGQTVAIVHMREGQGPLRPDAIRLIPDLGLAAEAGPQ